MWGYICLPVYRFNHQRSAGTVAIRLVLLLWLAYLPHTILGQVNVSDRKLTLKQSQTNTTNLFNHTSVCHVFIKHFLQKYEDEMSCFVEEWELSKLKFGL